jgi:hypothetical protein
MAFFCAFESPLASSFILPEFSAAKMERFAI